MPFYTLTPFNPYDVKNRRIRKKIHDITSPIPWGYRCASSPLRKNRKNRDQEIVPEYERLNEIAARYRAMHRKCRHHYWPHEYPYAHFKTQAAAIDFAIHNFDDEQSYYKWLKIERNIFQDEEYEIDDGDFESLHHYRIDKTDVWLKLHVTVHRRDEKGRILECTPEYVITDAPDYLKVIY